MEKAAWHADTQENVTETLLAMRIGLCAPVLSDFTFRNQQNVFASRFVSQATQPF